MKPFYHDGMTNIIKLLVALTLTTALTVALNLPGQSASPSHLKQQTHFQREQQAQQHCPDDTVVWVNVRTHVYHFKGQRWYGATRNGFYECREDANSEGDRATHNGQ